MHATFTCVRFRRLPGNLLNAPRTSRHRTLPVLMLNVANVLLVVVVGLASSAEFFCESVIFTESRPSSETFFVFDVLSHIELLIFYVSWTNRIIT